MLRIESLIYFILLMNKCWKLPLGVLQTINTVVNECLNVQHGSIHWTLLFFFNNIQESVNDIDSDDND